MAPEDSRRFSTSRLTSFSGYDDTPIVDSTLTFDLPPFHQHSGRIVAPRPAESRIPGYEAWSPNSMIRPFYAGLPPPNFEHRMPVDRTRRRFDGHLGPFDYTVNPQVLTREVWRAFILRPSVGYEGGYPEFKFVHQEWEVLAGRTPYGPSQGRIRPAYIDELSERLALIDSLILACSSLELTFTNFWSSRPSFPSRATVDDLRRLESYEDAVDLCVGVQRGIKEKAAYLVFANAVLDAQYQPAVDALVSSTIPRADDRYLGAWINGDRRQDALWLLSQKVPCFLVHALEGAESWLAQEPNACPTWWTGTQAALLRFATNGYDDVAWRSKAKVTPYVTSIIRARPPSALVATVENRERSSSSTQGWRGETIGEHTSRPLTPEREPSPMEVDETPAASNLDPTKAAAPLDLVVLHPDRVPWLRPPVVWDSQNSAGTWSKWLDDGDGKIRVMTRADKEDMEDEDLASCYYDRQLRREIYMDEPPVPEGLVTDVKIYGWPAPRATYWSSPGKQAVASYWIYGSRFDKSGKRGQPVPVPSGGELPRLAIIQTLPAASSSGTSTAPVVTPASLPPPIPNNLAEQRQRAPILPNHSLPLSVPLVLPKSPAEQRRRAPSDSGEISLGSEPEVEERATSCYLRTASFPLSTPWHDVRAALVALTMSVPEALILRVDRSSTGSRQTLWISLNSPEGAAALQMASAPRELGAGLGGELFWATAEELSQWLPLLGQTPFLAVLGVVLPRLWTIRVARAPEEERLARESVVGLRECLLFGARPPFRRLVEFLLYGLHGRLLAGIGRLLVETRDMMATARNEDTHRVADSHSPDLFAAPSPARRSVFELPSPIPAPVAPAPPPAAASPVIPPTGTREHALYMAEVFLEVMTRMTPGVAATAPPRSPVQAVVETRIPPPVNPQRGLMQRLNVGILERLSDDPSIRPPRPVSPARPGSPSSSAPNLVRRLGVGLDERISTIRHSESAPGDLSTDGLEDGEIGDEVAFRRKRGHRAGRDQQVRRELRLAAQERDRERARAQERERARREQRRRRGDRDFGSGHAHGGAL
ncbi:hypothetical protein FPV67DRAFT_1676177 [Lyophyllum atratum]|nr:hypothetical protein FPV67DRAFT_1676177 [Lyophyllum atratum]